VSEPSSNSLTKRLVTSVPAGLAVAALAWLVALGGVHLYSAPRLQFLLLFPAALAEPLSLPIQGIQWVTYAFLFLSGVRAPAPRAFRLALAALPVAHVGLGLIAFERMLPVSR
jgi:hypothetical protein